MKKTDAASTSKKAAPAHPTRNDIPAKTRTQVAALFSARLADAIDLMMQCKQAHWNVKGPQFAGLHEMFDTAHGEVSEYVDLLAERAVMLGAQVHGTVRAAAEHTSLKEYPLALQKGADHAKALSDAIAHFNKLVRQDIDHTTELGDAVSADILTEIARGSDKRLWMIEAHTQGGA